MNPKLLPIPLRANLTDRQASIWLEIRQDIAYLIFRHRFEFHADRVQPRLTPLRAKGYSRRPR